MAKDVFAVRLSAADVAALREKAEKLNMSPAVLARQYIKNGLDDFSEIDRMQSILVSKMETMMLKIEDVSMGSLLLMARDMAVKEGGRKEGESEAEFSARQFKRVTRIVERSIELGMEVSLKLLRKNRK